MECENIEFYTFHGFCFTLERKGKGREGTRTDPNGGACLVYSAGRDGAGLLYLCLS
jgi:hypothetical protein